MAAINELRHTAGFISSEANGNRSRDVVTVDGAATTAASLAAGTVLGKVDVGGKYIVYDASVSDGSENAAGILIEALDKGTADVSATILVRDAEVNGDELTASDAGAETDLLALGIIYR